jgi:hypothetical protein
MIISIHEYIAILMKFRIIMGISRVLLNFYKYKVLKNKAFSSYINQLYRDSKVFLRVIPKVSQYF